jgi:hypothetical protein
MPRHEDLDFDHAPPACDDCFDQQQRARQTTAMEKANDLKLREIEVREGGNWAEPTVAPKPRYVLPPPPPPQPATKLKWGQKGGMNIEPSG